MRAAIAFIGFGEAAQAFAGADGWSAISCAYDKLTDDSVTRAAKLEDYKRCQVAAAGSLQEALRDASTVLSLVTADQALRAATSARILRPGTLYCDMNSVSPATKRRAAAEIEGCSGRYVDVAIMAPVNPARLHVPLLLSGPAAPEAEALLTGVGFSNVRIIGAKVGDASAVKMIRSVIVKGIEALTAEAMLAADAANVVDEVLTSLESSEAAVTWRDRANYNLDRMIVHGVRRSDEMEEAVRTLDALGIEPILTRGTAQRQRQIGQMGLRAAAGLSGKLSQIKERSGGAA